MALSSKLIKKVNLSLHKGVQKIKLSGSEIKKHLAAIDTNTVTLDILESVSSTNDYFKGRPVSREFEFCFTEHQTQGRGRLGRTWHSPSGVNLMFSCRWCFSQKGFIVGAKNLSTVKLEGLSSCISLSLLAALRYLNIPDLMCKWPNDLFYQDKKLAGILIELYSHEGKMSEAIIGIGLNVNMINRIHTPENGLQTSSIEKPWTSLHEILGAQQDRNILAAKIIQSLISYLKRFADNGWEDFLAEWAEVDYLKGQEVSIPVDHQKRVAGIAVGVDLSGGLLVETGDNNITVCQSGEVWMCE